MTDLPALQSLLVGAAVRRRRRRQARRVVLAAAVVAAAVIVVPRGAPDDREVPAITPAPAPGWSVFDRPERPGDRAPRIRAGDVSRRIATGPEAKAYLVKTLGGRLCIVLVNPGVGRGCGDPGRTPSMLVGMGKGSGRLALALPNGVATVQLGTDAPVRAPVTTNGLIVDVPKWPVRVTWPGGEFFSRGVGAVPRAEDYFSVLKRPEQPSDQLDGLPGARLLVDRDGARAWIVPRLGTVCLVVKTAGVRGERTVSGCRQNLPDTRFPLIVAAPLGQHHVVAALFPDGARPGPIVLIEDERSVLRYTDPDGETRTEQLPARAANNELVVFFRHAKEADPREYKPQ
jgi:hypothetical protein